MPSTQEQISHVVRRMGMGAAGPTIADFATPQDAIGTLLDRTRPVRHTPEVEAPGDFEEARSIEQRQAPLRYLFSELTSGRDPLEERMTWFWHDHFATGARKVNVGWLILQQHLTIRDNALGNFADLLHAITVDPAMLVFLDGVENRLGAINENYGREVMELFTIGRGNYTEQDVIEASRAFSGWVINRPSRRNRNLSSVGLWESQFVPEFHDDDEKTYLGVTGNLGSADAINILLDQPTTSRNIVTKLYQELVGTVPDSQTLDELSTEFAADYEILPLVRAIVTSSGFLDGDVIGIKIRTPLERAAGILQAFGTGAELRFLARSLERVNYLPFNPPNVAGFVTGDRLLSPFSLVHAFDLAGSIREIPDDMSSSDILRRLGLFDVSPNTTAVLEAAPTVPIRVALAINSPEYHLT
ncbi:hypothetical protein BMS3Bbin02_00651 [bacterium BMS3Bbin02]|nr:hypothetical protein BMS3Bbin02_00651 [bacterium BMS3Bbin02]HDH27053.1 DUF1800 domain-containing protein [Actinomycetota bacterium]